MAITAHQTDEPSSQWTRLGLARMAGKGAVITGLFCIAVCALMLVSHFRAGTDDPLKAPQLSALKDSLISRPSDEQLKEQIRSLDLGVRRRYFRELWLNRSGAWLALGALGLFLVAAKQAMTPGRWLPTAQPPQDRLARFARATTRARWSVGVLAAALAAALGSLALRSHSALPANAQAIDSLLNRGSAAAGHLADFASATEMRQNWPRFRGPDGNGIASVTNSPLSWDSKSGRGIVWKTAVPVAGFNSPIVWGERVFLSGGDAAKREVLCFGAQKGELLWERPVQVASGPGGKFPELPEQTGYAASSMATDGRRVYAMFASGDLAAFALDGKQVWSKNLGVPKNPHGHASSLLTWEGRLIVQLDQGEAQQNLSKLYAFDGASGQILWQHNRPVSTSWATPIVIDASGKPQILTLGVPWVIGYAPNDGAEIWRLEGLSNEVTPSPVFAGGLVLAVSPNEKLLAIRPNGQGDVTKTHLAWSVEDNIPDISSPVSNGELVFTLSTPGVLTCYDSKDGKKVWEHDFGIEFNVSPTVVGQRLYLAGIKGVVVVVEIARDFKELARSDLGENLYASPAFVRERIFFRGATHLFCIGPDASLAKAE